MLMYFVISNGVAIKYRIGETCFEALDTFFPVLFVLNCNGGHIALFENIHPLLIRPPKIKHTIVEVSFCKPQIKLISICLCNNFDVYLMFLTTLAL